MSSSALLPRRAGLVINLSVLVSRVVGLAYEGFPGVLVLRAPRKGPGPSIYAAEIHQLMSGDLSVDRLLQRSID
ncbi:hypothetical protein M0R45_005430 [Rubus argutus]|uniref:Uncharacterized protein n=1 Tax=Rubus argutus TaxID=59490 RepID=A0AAW1YMT6_RUBAR